MLEHHLYSPSPMRCPSLSKADADSGRLKHGRVVGCSWSWAVPSADSQLNRHATVAVAAAACDTKSQAQNGRGRGWHGSWGKAGQAKCLCQVSDQTHGHRVACGRTTTVLQSGQCLLRLTTQKKRLKSNACCLARTLFRCAMNLYQQVRGAEQG